MTKFLTTAILVFIIVILLHWFIRCHPGKVAAIKAIIKSDPNDILVLTGGNIGGSANVPAVAAQSNAVKFPIGLGSTGKAVAIIQAGLGVAITGVFDKHTQSALKAQTEVTSVDKNTFTAFFENTADQSSFPLVLGSRSIYAMDVQILLGVHPTGTLDPNTVQALEGVGVTMPFTNENYQNLVANTLQIKLADTTSITITDPIDNNPMTGIGINPIDVEKSVGEIKKGGHFVPNPIKVPVLENYDYVENL